MFSGLLDHPRSPGSQNEFRTNRVVTTGVTFLGPSESLFYYWYRGQQHDSIHPTTRVGDAARIPRPGLRASINPPKQPSSLHRRWRRRRKTARRAGHALTKRSSRGSWTRFPCRNRPPRTTTSTSAPVHPPALRHNGTRSWRSPSA